jgi:hypothetical protein
MSLVSVRTVTPFAGKSALAAERARTLADIYTRHGGKARVASVIAGDLAGQIALYVGFDDGKSMGEVFEKYQADPAYAKLREEHGLNPAGSVSGPEVYRFVYGQAEPGYPISLHREYTMSRDKVADALALMPELDALGQAHDIKVAAAVPVFSSDMARFIANYRYRSPAHLGAAIDGVGMSAEFQALVNRAAALGSLTRSRVISFM